MRSAFSMFFFLVLTLCGPAHAEPIGCYGLSNAVSGARTLEQLTFLLRAPIAARCPETKARAEERMRGFSIRSGTREERAYGAALRAGTQGGFEDFLQRYPDGRYAEIIEDVLRTFYEPPSPPPPQEEMPPPPPDCPSNVVVLPFEGGNDLISQADEKKLQAAVSEARMCSLSGVIVFDLAAESPSENRLRFTAESVRASAVRQRLRELGVPEEALAVGETGNAGASNNAMSQRFQSQSRVEVQFLFGRLHASWKTAAARAAAAGGPINARRFQDCYECPEMVAIPKGEVTIGEGGAAKRFSIEAMAVSRLEITSREFRAIRPEQWEECSTPDAISGEWRAFIDQVGWYRSEPAVCVNFADAEAYVSALNAKVAGAPYRLLTEAEWEYAARAGANTAFWWGDRAEDACKHANSADASAVNLVTISSCDDGQPGLSEGGKFGENAFGLADMAGNVWEWTRDCFGTEPIAPQTGNDTTSASQCGTRVVRGGSWTSMPEFLRSSSRFGAHANGRFTNQGFRIARRIDAE